MRRPTGISICVLLLAASCLGANMEKHAQAFWLNTPMLLRTCPVETSLLSIDADGQLAGAAEGPSRDLCIVEFSSVKLLDDKLLFEGKLTHVKPQGDDLTLGIVNEMVPFKISISCEKKKVTEHRLWVFDTRLFSHLPLEPNKPVPQYFRKIIQQYIGNEKVPGPPSVGWGLSASADPTLKGVVHAPKIRSTPDPEYSKDARARGIQGTVVVWMIVNKDGHTENPQVIRPLGFGLDEQAVNAVRKWTFDPATRGKNPVPVLISVEVNFHTY